MILPVVFVLLVACVETQPRMPVRVIDYESNLGNRPADGDTISYDGRAVRGVKVDRSDGLSVVILKDEDGNFIKTYSETNTVELGHLKEKYYRVNVYRYFYSHDQFKACLSACLIPITFGASASMESTVISRQINMTLPEDMLFAPNGFFEKKFINGEPIDMILSVSNTGTLPLRNEFIVVDVLPDYLEFISAEYNAYPGSAVWDVGYDVHIKGNKQILVFKIKPADYGLAFNDTVQIKISARPNLEKFKRSPYKVKGYKVVDKVSEEKDGLLKVKEKTKF